MNAKTQYELGHVIYGYQGGKWHFEVKGCFTRIERCPGGLKTATVVAQKINSSVKRTKTYVEPLDGLARYEISQVVNPQVEGD